ncbi:MAG: hypothetical protein JXR96_11315 [Deltaproteobacteria bacterium]|nr:hypothetical protein [Deltaproteobacteria bacterium]
MDFKTIRSLVAASLALLLVSLFGSGCASILYTSKYSSDVRHEPLPMRSTVTVLVDEKLRKDWDEDKRNQLEYIRESFQEALKADLLENGPLTPVGVDPEARLEVKLKAVKAKDLKLWIMMWFLAPIWLFGVPMYSGQVDLGVDIKLTAATGEPLYRSVDSAGCHRYQGIYYGHEDLAFGCPARKIGEKLRERLSSNRAEILARLEKSQRLHPVAAAAPRGPKPIAVVFKIHDKSGTFEDSLMEQLTEYLAVQVGQHMGLMITPRDQVRERLSTAKTESYKKCYDQSCQIELGKALAANKSVSTTLIKVGKHCVFNTTVIDLKTEAAEKAASAETGCDEDSLLLGVKKVVSELKD